MSWEWCGGVATEEIECMKSHCITHDHMSRTFLPSRSASSVTNRCAASALGLAWRTMSNCRFQVDSGCIAFPSCQKRGYR